MAVILGTAGPDVLFGSFGDDSLDGGAGNDTLDGAEGADTLVGGAGNDVYYGVDAQDTVLELEGGGEDWLYLSLRADERYVIPFGIEHAHLVYVSHGVTSTLVGNALDNFIGGNDESNRLEGGAGADTLYGEHGNDSLYGGEGRDVLSGGFDDDLIEGGAGDDVLSDFSGTDTLLGGAGDDQLVTKYSDGNSLLDGGAGDDELEGGRGNDTLSGGAGVDILSGGAGNDTYLITDLDDFTFEKFGEGDDTLIVSINGAKLITANIEHVQYINNAAPLAYWVDALVSGFSWTPIGSVSTLTYAFATSDPDPSFRPFSADDQTAARQAMALWAAPTQMSWREVPAGQAQIIFAFANLAPYGAAGLTEVAPNGSSVIVWIDDDAMGGGLSNNTDWVHVLLHEIGHAIGLKHPGNYNGSDGQGEPPFLGNAEDSTTNTQLSYNDAADWQAEYDTTLRPFDIAAAQWLYGVNPSLAPGNTTYRLSALAWPNTLISDGAGLDTLDASDITPPANAAGAEVTLDLRPGTRSFVGVAPALISAAGQVSINYGSLIENAIGSRGRDELFGNTGNNSLTGGLGNDTLHGSSGQDTLDGGAGDDTFALDWAGRLGSVDTSLLRGGAGTDVLRVRVDQALLTAADMTAMIALRGALNGVASAAAIGLTLDGIERLEWINPSGQIITNFAPAVRGVVVTTDEDIALSADLPAAQDYEGQPLRYTLVASPNFGRVSLSADGHFSYTPDAEYSGNDSFSYSVSDGLSSSNANVAIRVARVDDAPQLQRRTLDQSVGVGATVQGSVWPFIDIDSPQLSYRLEQSSGAALPSWLHFDAGSRSFSGVPTAADVGIYTLRVTARGDSTSASDDFIIGVFPTGSANALPVGVNGSAQLVEETAFEGRLPAATDADGDPLRYEIYAQPYPAGPGNAQTQFELQADGRFSYTPPADFFGTAWFSYTVSDGRGGSALYTFELVVANTEDPVVGEVSIDEYRLAVGGQLFVRSTLYDPDGLDQSSPRQTWLRNGTLVSGPDTYNLRLGFVDIGATFVLRYSIRDFLGNVYTFETAPTAAVPSPPVTTGTAGNDRLDFSDRFFEVHIALGLSGDDILIGGNGRDSLVGGEGNDLIDGKGGDDILDGGDGDDRLVVLGEAATVRGGAGDDTLVFSLGQQLNKDRAAELIRLIAHLTDAQLLPALGLDVSGIEHLVLGDSFTVNGNFAPVAIDAGYELYEDSSLRGQLPAGLDIEGSALTYRLSYASPSGRFALSADGSFVYTPEANFVGTEYFSYQVFDGTLLSFSTATVFLNVANVNDPPALSQAILDVSAQVGVALAVWPLNFGNASIAIDRDGDTLTCTAQLESGAPLPAWLSFDPVLRKLTGTASSKDVGLLNIRLTLADAEFSVSDVFVLGVHEQLNHPPVARDATFNGVEDQVLTGQLPEATDADGDPVHYEWLTDSYSGRLTIQPGGAFSFAPSPDGYGTFQLSYRVNDGRGGDTVQYFVVRLAPVNDPHTGTVRVAGIAEIGQQLGASPGDLADVDGLGYFTSFVWLRDGVAIAQEISGGGWTYTLTGADYGAEIQVRMQFVDGTGTTETSTSPPSARVGGSAHSIGSAIDNTLLGTAAPDWIEAREGNDTLTGAAQNDTLDGGSGIDTAVYADTRAQATLTRASPGIRWDVATATEGTDTLIDIERLRFSDVSVALDLDPNGHAGQTAKVIGAVFGKQYLSNKDFVGIGLQLLDGGMAYKDLVSLAVGTDLFKQLAGATAGVAGGVVSNTQFVNFVYRNVVGAAPSPQELADFVGLLNSNAYTQSSLALAACDASVNLLHIDLVGLAAHGIEFIPQPGG